VNELNFEVNSQNIGVVTWRGSVAENLHRIDAAVVSSDGRLLYGFGNPNKWICARSSVKPIQAISVLESGAADHYQLTDEEISQLCASHNGERIHVDTVKGMLDKAGLPYECIQTGGQDIKMEYGNPDGINDEPRNLRHNCSGKHSGMVLTAAHLGEDLSTYYEVDHPVQQRILDNLSLVTGYPREKISIGIDGCGVPVHGMPLKYFAQGFARMTEAEKHFGPEKGAIIDRITHAMTKHPYYVAGKNRFCTEFMEAAGGAFFGKVGAQGVYLAASYEDKIGIAIKCEDGGSEWVASALIHIIKQLGLDRTGFTDKLQHWYRPISYNARGQEVGYSEAIFQLENYQL